MISKAQFEEAEFLIKQYKAQINNILIGKHICAICKTKEIKPLDDVGFVEGHISAVEQERGCWDGGNNRKNRIWLWKQK